MSLSVNQEFEAKLKVVMDHRTDLRPFVCDGLPLECKIFIVGYNPATEMSQSFWKFWNSDTGFNKAAWLEAYQQERSCRQLKPGRTRRNRKSSTRQRIDWITEAASPIKCLETNLYSKATEKAKDLSITEQEDKIFNFLIQEIRPKVVLLHGVQTRRHLEKLDYFQIDSSEKRVLNINSEQVELVEVPHLSRGCSRYRAEELGEHLREICRRV